MCEFHDSNCNGFGDMWWTDKCTYFSSIDLFLFFQTSVVYFLQVLLQNNNTLEKICQQTERV